MFQVSICPSKEILKIDCNDISQAKDITRKHYPHAVFMEATGGRIAIYERLELDLQNMNHVGNIWPL